MGVGVPRRSSDVCLDVHGVGNYSSKMSTAWLRIQLKRGDCGIEGNIDYQGSVRTC